MLDTKKCVRREKFIPVTRFALMDRLTAPECWPQGKAKEARRFFLYLDYWRHQQHQAHVLALEQMYEPFSPDSDLLMTRKFTDDERRKLQAQVIRGITCFLRQANYERIDPSEAEILFTQDTTYGLDFHVDMDAFEEILIYYRGKSVHREERRTWRKFYFKEYFDIPIYRRLCLIFKLKPLEMRINELMKKEKLTRKEAERKAKRLRALFPPMVKDDFIYMKMFKNIPANDIEMVFPNTQVKFRLWDKVKLGAGAGSGVTYSVAAAAGKLGVIISNPMTAATAAAGLGTIIFRQVMNFVNQKQRYMVVMAQNLYFHSMADNRGVMIKLADRAAEEDVKEEILLYCVLAKEKVYRSQINDVDRGIERYLADTFGINVDFDVEDALERLLQDGVVREEADGRLVAFPPAEAAAHLDAKWDVFLDHLPDPGGEAGREFEGGREPQPEV